MGRSPGFGSTQCNSIARLGLAFAAAPWFLPLNLATQSNSPDHYAKGTRSGRPDSQVMRETLPLLVGKWFQVLFHSPPGVLFTFPSRY